MRLGVFIFPLRCNFIQFGGYGGFEATTQTQHTKRKFLSDIIFTAEKKSFSNFHTATYTKRSRVGEWAVSAFRLMENAYIKLSWWLSFLSIKLNVNSLESSTKISNSHTDALSKFSRERKAPRKFVENGNSVKAFGKAFRIFIGGCDKDFSRRQLSYMVLWTVFNRQVHSAWKTV